MKDRAVACLAMVFIAETAQKSCRKLNSSLLLRDIINGVKFEDGTKVGAE